jgi:hypothetical protein
VFQLSFALARSGACRLVVSVLGWVGLIVVAMPSKISTIAASYLASTTRAQTIWLFDTLAKCALMRIALIVGMGLKVKFRQKIPLSRKRLTIEASCGHFQKNAHADS